MEINKLTNHTNGQVNGTQSSEGSKSASKVTPRDRADEVSDKVSLNNFKSRKNEQVFAKIELEKLNSGSFNKLKAYKAKLQEYEAAKKVSDEAAANTEIGKMINDPDVWTKIAQNISDK